MLIRVFTAWIKHISILQVSSKPLRIYKSLSNQRSVATENRNMGFVCRLTLPNHRLLYIQCVYQTFTYCISSISVSAYLRPCQKLCIFSKIIAFAKRKFVFNKKSFIF